MSVPVFEQKRIRQHPPLLIGAFAALICGLVFTVLACFIDLTSIYRIGLLFIAAALFCFAIGEMLNHPRQVHLEYNDINPEQPEQVRHHTRNPCALGNLLVIVSLLLFFMGLARFISF